MTKQHTPGPWHVEPSPDRVHFDIRADGVHVPHGSGKGAANARLIAAAPDLLAALKAASGSIDDCGMSLEAYGNLIDQIDAAITKAEEG